MLTFAQGRGLVAQNVVRGVRIKVDKRDAETGPLRAGVDFPTMGELNKLIENSAGRWRPFIVTAIFTGMRLSELRGLSWDGVDLEKGQIHIRQRADGWGKIGPMKTRAGKRDIPIAPIVVNTLKQWQSECPRVNGASCSRTPSATSKRCRIFMRDFGCRCRTNADLLTTASHVTASTCYVMLPPAYSSNTLAGHQAAANRYGSRINHDDLRPLRASVRRRYGRSRRYGEDRSCRKGSVVQLSGSIPRCRHAPVSQCGNSPNCWRWGQSRRGHNHSSPALRMAPAHKGHRSDNTLGHSHMAHSDRRRPAPTRATLQLLGSPLRTETLSRSLSIFDARL
jgi:hypothetical protein